MSNTPTDPLEGEMQELIAFMGSIGFEYRPNEHYSYFAKDEGTCELTVEGAEEMFIAIKALIAKSL